MKEIDKMLSGMIYDPNDEEIIKIRRNAHKLCLEYNLTEETSNIRENLIKQIFPNSGKGIFVQGPLNIDYGEFTYIGDNFYANFNLTILDTCPVKIGNNVFIGPNVSIYTPIHPFLPREREYFLNNKNVITDYEYAKPISIGNDCWIAGNVTICGGVKIGNGCVIGAGSVVIHDIPDNSLAAGNPCRKIREITEKDSIFNNPLLREKNTDIK